MNHVSHNGNEVITSSFGTNFKKPSKSHYLHINLTVIMLIWSYDPRGKSSVALINNAP